MTIQGTLNIRDWDLGCFITLDAFKHQYVVDGSTRDQYVINVPGLNSGIEELDNKVPVFHKYPENAYSDFIKPCIVFEQQSLDVAFDRHPWYTWVARDKQLGATKIVLPDGRVGYDRYVKQWRASQFDIQYDCTIMARRRQESNMLIQYVLRRFIPPWFIFKVFDSLGDVREYDAGDMSFSNTSDLIDISDRVAGWTISFTIKGEIDIHDDREMPAMTQFGLGVSTKES